eukprot:gnl/Dysnectes_brevis/2855_a3486_580.p1 GENE.gnl/Dysnectes_brevis/2855_a3486_580~~gnl/Dysnectes_brevis/2855_a3486_580.p1  ORF type:complete len:1368 (+),score=271.52 gnl/Dysnectes_brevis/2855_a3486_580:67-4170(+)
MSEKKRIKVKVSRTLRNYLEPVIVRNLESHQAFLARITLTSDCFSIDPHHIVLKPYDRLNLTLMVEDHDIEKNSIVLEALEITSDETIRLLTLSTEMLKQEWNMLTKSIEQEDIYSVRSQFALDPKVEFDLSSEQTESSGIEFDPLPTPDRPDTFGLPTDPTASPQYLYQYGDEVPEEVQCYGCRGPAASPLMLACGPEPRYLICMACASRLPEEWKCPECGSPHCLIKVPQVTRSGLDDKYQVHCPHGECRAIIKLTQLREHLRDVCLFSSLACRCKTAIGLYDLVEHLSRDCPLRPCNCRICKKRMPFEDLREHFEIQHPECKHCGGFLVRPNHPDHLATIPCPFGCGETLSQCMLDMHKSRCPERQVACPNSSEEHPCTCRVRYSGLEQHIAEQCPNTEVQCPHCHEQLPRRSLEHHEAVQCSHRPVPCLNPLGAHKCGWIGRPAEVKAHLTTCPNTPVTCRHCKRALPSGELGAHERCCDERVVSCPNREEDHPCAWSGEQRRVEQHLLGCPQQLVACDQCGDMIRRLNRAPHSEECPKQDITCPQHTPKRPCPWNGKREDLEDHIQVCLNSKIPCPECRRPTFRYALEAHERVCPNVVVSCPTHSPTQQCQWRGKRKQLKHHLERNCINVKISCPKCKLKVPRWDQKRHIEEDCPRRHVRCPNAPECRWNGLHSSLRNHLRKCRHKPQPRKARKASPAPLGPRSVRCPNQPCPWLGSTQRELDVHQDTCPEARTTCERCEAAIIRRQTPAHDEVCPSLLVVCPHCHVNLPRSHQDTCQASIVTCDFEKCAWRGPRGRLEGHPCAHNRFDCFCGLILPRHKLAEHRLACDTFIASCDTCPICSKGLSTWNLIAVKHVKQCVQSASCFSSRFKSKKMKLKDDRRTVIMTQSAKKTALLDHPGFTAGVFEWDFGFTGHGHYTVGVATPQAPCNALGEELYPNSIGVCSDGSVLVNTSDRECSEWLSRFRGSEVDGRKMITLRLDFNAKAMSWSSKQKRPEVSHLGLTMPKFSETSPLVPAVSFYGRGEVRLAAFRHITPESIDIAPDGRVSGYSPDTVFPAACVDCRAMLGTHIDAQQHLPLCRIRLVDCPSPDCSWQGPMMELVRHVSCSTCSNSVDLRTIDTNAMVLEFAIQADDLSLTIPTLRVAGEYNAVIDWGDTSTSDVTSWNSPGLTHTYSYAKSYTVRITGQFPSIRFDSSGHPSRKHNRHATKLVRIHGLGCTGLTRMDHAFRGCINLTTVSGFAVMSSVSNMISMFAHCESLTHVDISHWDVSSVSSMSGMFKSCIQLESLDIRDWNISRTVDTSAMFVGCVSLRDLDLSAWDTSNVQNMCSMFRSCSVLSSLGPKQFKQHGQTTNIFNRCPLGN